MPHASGPHHRPRADRLANREVLLATYVRLVARGARPGLEEVARAAGIGRATAYRHFGDRTGLRAAAFLTALDEVNRVVDEVPERPGLGAPEAFEVVAAAALEASARFALASIEWPTDDRAQNRRFDALMGPLARLVERHQRAGAIDAELPPRFVAEAFVGLIESASLHVDALEDAPATIARVLLRGTEPG